MKIAVLSDIHGNLAYLAKAKEQIDEAKVKTVICCGDIQDSEALLELNSWKQTVYVVWGNADYVLENMIENGFIEVSHLKIFEKLGEVELENRKIAFTHYNYLAPKIAETGKYDVVFYGHRHTPWTQTVGKTLTLNPGEIAAQYGKPTFAIFDLATMTAELKILS